jgi:small subunit ribosomal protein S3
MGQKVRPTGFRVGVYEPWRSRWYAPKKEFSRNLLQDLQIRRHIKNNYHFAGIPRIDIERQPEVVKITVHTARPGILIGKKGAKVEKLREELETICKSKVDLDIFEITKPELSAQLVAENIAEQLEKRASFRRTVKKALSTTMQMGAFGCKVRVSGRLGGSEMARTQKQGEGSVPLATLRANIDYGFAESKTSYGTIGVKCWIYVGEYPRKKAAEH